MEWQLTGQACANRPPCWVLLAVFSALTQQYSRSAVDSDDTQRAPEFVQRLKGEETVDEGRDLTLNFKVVGVPRPTLRWFKDNEEVKDHGRLTVEEGGDGSYQLTLHAVNKGDQAAYRCKAENSEGASSCCFFLAVKGRAKSPRRESKNCHKRTVSFPTMFSTIVEKVEEEEKAGKEASKAPESPLTHFYDSLTLKSRASWPSFLGDWAFVDGTHKARGGSTGSYSSSGSEGDHPRDPDDVVREFADAEGWEPDDVFSDPTARAGQASDVTPPQDVVFLLQTPQQRAQRVRALPPDVDSPPAEVASRGKAGQLLTSPSRSLTAQKDSRHVPPSLGNCDSDGGVVVVGVTSSSSSSSWSPDSGRSAPASSSVAQPEKGSARKDVIGGRPKTSPPSPQATSNRTSVGAIASLSASLSLSSSSSSPASTKPGAKPQSGAASWGQETNCVSADPGKKKTPPAPSDPSRERVGRSIRRPAAPKEEAGQRTLKTPRGVVGDFSLTTDSLVTLGGSSRPLSVRGPLGALISGKGDATRKGWGSARSSSAPALGRKPLSPSVSSSAYSRPPSLGFSTSTASSVSKKSPTVSSTVSSALSKDKTTRPAVTTISSSTSPILNKSPSSLARSVEPPKTLVVTTTASSTTLSVSRKGQGHPGPTKEPAKSSTPTTASPTSSVSRRGQNPTAISKGVAKTPGSTWRAPASVPSCSPAIVRVSASSSTATTTTVLVSAPPAGTSGPQRKPNPAGKMWDSSRSSIVSSASRRTGGSASTSSDTSTSSQGSSTASKSTASTGVMQLPKTEREPTPIPPDRLVVTHAATDSTVVIDVYPAASSKTKKLGSSSAENVRLAAIKGKEFAYGQPKAAGGQPSGPSPASTGPKPGTSTPFVKKSGEVRFSRSPPRQGEGSTQPPLRCVRQQPSPPAPSQLSPPRPGISSRLPREGGTEALYFDPVHHELVHVKRLHPDTGPLCQSHAARTRSDSSQPSHDRPGALERESGSQNQKRRSPSPSPKPGEPSDSRGRKRNVDQRPKSDSGLAVYSSIASDPEGDLVYQYLRELVFLLCLLTFVGLTLSITPIVFVTIVLVVHLTLFFSRKYVLMRKRK